MGIWYVGVGMWIVKRRVSPVRYINMKINCRYITLLKNIDVDKDKLENIDIDSDINKAILENIDIDINKDILENIDIDINNAIWDGSVAPHHCLRLNWVTSRDLKGKKKC